ncbi:MAG: M20/M25/M40 family metallo-hydrolase [Anaerolineales bacterium]|nr:M20/M25/M40 family metallo-hydrolase [Anaerolineales bacterium]
MRLPATSSAASPRLGAAQIRLLEKLCNACAVSGDEGEVRAIVLKEIAPYVDELRTDALGNVLAVRQGSGKRRLRVMLAAHMDEVGFMLTQEEEREAGCYRFELVGGVDVRQIAGKAVWIGPQHTPGVIGVKPLHLASPDERNQSLSLESLRIDLGGESSSAVKPGDRAVFATAFSRIGSSLRAKALDDRLGVASLIQLLRHAPPNVDLLAAFTVQEEVGLRGASVAAYALDPDLAIVLDSTPANDLPLMDAGRAPTAANTRYNTRLGAGPAIYLADAATLSDPRLVRHLAASAEEAGLPYQFRQPGRGGTDAGAIHLARSGVPSVSVSVPTRYLHGPASIARLSDWQNSFLLVHHALSRLIPEILNQER